MYYRNRAEAGRLLADRLIKHKNTNTTVIALSTGGVIVGAQIAMRLHSTMSMLLTENIILPGELDPLAVIASDNTFTYNDMFSAGELEMMRADYLHVIEGQRLTKLRKLHALLGYDGEINRDLLQRRTVILVSDGLNNGLSLDMARDYLKPVKTERIVVAVPVASVDAVDKMHLVGDEIECLSVKPNYLGTDHYYDDNTVPPVKDLLKVITTTPVHWDRGA